MKKYNKALVLGLGDSGAGAACLLVSEDTAVTVLDGGTSDAIKGRTERLRHVGVDVRLQAATLPEGEYDVCIVSPGISENSSWVQSVRERGIPVLSELEFGWSRCQGRVLAVTGSNGKSTVVKWCADAVEKDGQTARIAGNYGFSVCEEVRKNPASDIWILEVSSFQLETTDAFRPDVGLLLNILPNHLDRHGSMDAYMALKARLFENTVSSDVCVVPTDLLDEMRTRSGGRGQWTTFGPGEGAEYRYRDRRLVMPDGQCGDLEGTLYGNEVMGPSAAGVVAAMDGLGVSREGVCHSLRLLDPLPHRVERIADIKGVRFINDSKATNLAAMSAAVRMCSRPVRLIAGGLAKEKDFNSVKEVLAERAVSVYLIGTASDNMASAWSDVVPIMRCDTLTDATREAWRNAREGETILLSPGCASFDQFQNFEERGNQFKGIVKKLAEEEEK